MKHWWHLHRTDVTLTVVGLALGLAGGAAASGGRQAAILVVSAAFALLMVLTRPALLGAAALVSCFAVQRVGGGAVSSGAASGISYSDVIIVAATAIAVPSLVVGPEARRLRLALLGLGIYLACLLPAVVLDDSSRSLFEFGHRLFLVGGALVVGAWIVREGYTRNALRGVVAAAAVLAVLAIQYTLTHDLSAPYPFNIHKNFIGAQLSVSTVLVLMAPRKVLGVSPAVRTWLALLIGGGLIASQSRGAMLAAAVGIVFVIAFSPRAQGRQARAAVLLVGLALASVMVLSIRADLSKNAADLHNSSIGVRRQVEERTREIWRTSPMTGVGLKYFNSGEYGELAQPANVVIDNELAEAGVIGLLGFTLMQGLCIGAGIARRREPYVIVGTACVIVHLTHGMVDIYWTAGTVTLPFILLGMGLGSAPPTERSDQPKISESARVKTASHDSEATAAGAAEASAVR